MKPAHALCLLLLLGLPVGAKALGLGQVEVYSGLNEPLEARIQLNATAEELDQIEVLLGSVEQFEKAGLDRTSFLLQLQFELELSPKGNFILMNTRNPVREPFLNFLVQVSWRGGRLIREYALLFDPPGYDTATTSSETRTAAPTTPQVIPPKVIRPPPSPKRTERVVTGSPARQTGAATRSSAASPRSSPERVPPQTRTAPPATVPSRRPSTVALDASGAYTVQRGDTLWALAIAMRQDRSASIQQMMFALLRKNPDAFFLDGNINALRAGKILRPPTAAEIKAVSRAQAFAQTARHNDLWAAYKSGRGAPAPRAGTPPPKQPPPRGPAPPVAGTGTAAGSRGASGQVKPATPRPAQQQGSPASAPPPQPRVQVLSNGDGAGSADAGRRVQQLQGQLNLAQEELESKQQALGETGEKLQAAESLIRDLEKKLALQDNQLSQMQQSLQQSKKQAEIAGQQEQAAAQQAAAEQAAAQQAAAEQAAAQKAAAQKAAAEQAAAQKAAAQKAAAQKAAAQKAAAQKAAAQKAAAQKAAAQKAAAEQAAAQQAAAQQAAAQKAAAQKAAAQKAVAEKVLVKAGDQPPSQQESASPAEPPAEDSWFGKIKNMVSNMVSSISIPSVSLPSLPGGIAVWGGGALALLAAIGGFIVVRRRRAGIEAVEDSLDFDEFTEEDQDMFDEADVTAVAEVSAEEAAEEATATPEASLEQPAPDGEEEISVPGLDEITDLPELEEGDLEFTAHDDVDEAGEARMAEVNVLMAYGQFDRAAEFMQEALEEEPDNLAYHLKLLEIYSAMNDPGSFESAAKSLQEKTGGSGEQWQAAVGMWEEMKVGRELFSGNGEEAGDDVLATQQLSPELAKQVMQEAESSDEAGEALDFPAAGEEPAAGGEDDVDALVQELQAESGTGEDETAAEGASAAGEQTEELPSLDFDSGESTEALPSLDLQDADAGGVEEALDLSGLGDEEGGGDEAEAGSDDLSLSLEDAGEEMPSLELEEDAGEAEAGSDDLSLALEGDAGEETPALELEEGAEESNGELAVEMTELPDSDDSGIDLDLEIASEPVVEEDTDTTGLNGDDASTKLDLARAYMELGDTENARTSLQDVIAEGDAGQRSEAEKLLSKLS